MSGMDFRVLSLPLDRDPRRLVPQPMADEPTPIAQGRGPDRRHVGRHGRVRPYRPSGLYRQASPAPELQQAMDHLRAQLLTDKGGPEAVTHATPASPEKPQDRVKWSSRHGSFRLFAE